MSKAIIASTLLILVLMTACMRLEPYKGTPPKVVEQEQIIKGTPNNNYNPDNTQQDSNDNGLSDIFADTDADPPVMPD